jgi:large subunit ribosomal protein L9
VARARPTSKTSTKRRGPGGDKTGGKRKICHFCKDKVEEVDYKNANALRRYISEKGKIRSRRIRTRWPSRSSAPARWRSCRTRGPESMARKQHRAILLQDVDHLGARGDVVSVKSGYLRNYLVPRRLAEQATEARINEIKQTESVRAKQQARTTEQAQEIARTLTTTILTIPVLAGAGDRLYGSVTPADIADEIWRARKIRVDRRKVQLEEPIRRLGTYQVDIEVFPEVIATVKTMVVPAEGSTFDLPVPED